MVHIETYTSHEAMQDAITRNKEAALRGLHPAQANLTWGSHWVQFTEDHMVVFGRISTEDEVKEGEDPGEADAILDITRQDLEYGLMYGVAHSAQFPEEEYGHTHKISVWPIEKELFDAAREVDWAVESLPEGPMLQLRIAAAEFQANVLDKR